MRKLITILLLFFFSSPALAGEQTVTFTLFARGWPPFEMVRHGKPVGMAYDIFKAIMPKDITPAIEANPAPRKRLYVTELPVYARLECEKWVKRKNEWLWSVPVMTMNNVLYSPRSRPIEYTGIESLEGKTIGCIKNYTYPAVEHLFQSGRAQRYDVNSDTVLLRMLKAGRVDAAVLDSSATRWVISTIADIEAKDFHIAEKPVDTALLRFAFNKAPGWHKRLPEINTRIREVRKNGELEAIFARYR